MNPNTTSYMDTGIPTPAPSTVADHRYYAAGLERAKDSVHSGTGRSSKLSDKTAHVFMSPV